MGDVTGALGRLRPASAITAWTPQPVAIAVATLLVLGYVAARRRAPHAATPARTATFGLGVLLVVWSGCGFWQVYDRSLYWVWTSQTLLVWLGAPIVLLAGHPVQLARSVPGWGARIDRTLQSRPARVVANPLVGPALVPVLSFVLFFGPLPSAANAVPSFGWVLQVVLLVVGALMVLPLVGLDEDVTSLAVGLSLLVGAFELVLDALPGIVLRLKTSLVTSWWDHRTVHPWSPRPLHDQGYAGAILWCIAELIDLPFLVLVFARWIRADARDAARVDAVLEAERVATGRDEPPAGSAAADESWDSPWWLSDPAMRRHLDRPD